MPERRHVHRGVDGDADETDSDHAGEAGAGEPFQPAARAIAGFAEIDERQLALRSLAIPPRKMDGSPRARAHEGLTQLSSRETIAALKQSAFPPLPVAALHAIGVPSRVRRTAPKPVILPSGA